MAEFEELRLTVNLVDNASSGLQRLRGEIGQLTQSAGQMVTGLNQASTGITNLGAASQRSAPGLRTIAQDMRAAEGAALGLGRSFGQLSIATQGLRSLPQIAGGVGGMALALNDLSKAAEAVVPGARMATIAIGGIGLAVAGVGAAVVAYGVSVFRFAREMDNLGKTARTLGMSFSELKGAQEQARSFGMAAETVIRNFQGIQDAQLDLYKNNSQLRQRLLSQGVNNEWINQLAVADPTKAQNLVRAYGKALEKQALDAGVGANVARAIANQFVREFKLDPEIMDMPEIAPLSAEQRRNLEEVKRLSKEVMDIWNPLSAKMEKMGLELLKAGLPFIKSTFEEIERIINGIEAATRKIKEYWEALRPDSAKGAIQERFDRFRTTPQAPGGGPFDRYQPGYKPTSFTDNAIEDNTTETERLTGQLERLNNFYDSLQNGTTGQGGFMRAAYTPPGGSGFGGGRGGGGASSFGGGGYVNLDPGGRGGGDGGGGGVPSQAGQVPKTLGGGGVPSGSDTGGSAGGAATGKAGDPAVPSDILSRAKEVALQSGPGGVASFMASQGYPKNGAWCGQFAASVVKSVGGTPPQNPAIASNWRNWGTAVDTPQPGDVAIRKGVRTGSTGSHVTFVEGGVDPKTGRFTGLGGNQGSWRSQYPASQFEFRRGGPMDGGAVAGQGGAAGAIGGKISGTGDVNEAIRSTAQTAGMDEAHWKAIASIESSLNPSSNVNARTQYKGLFQIGTRGSDSEWARMGDGNVYNAQDNAEAAARLAQDNNRRFKARFGRDPTPTETYMMHQQGLGFYTKGKMTNIGGNPYPGMRGPQTPASFEAGWGREIERRAALYQDRNALDRGAITRNQTEVNATGKLSVDVNAPPGTKVAASGTGLFKDTEMQRSTQMPYTDTGPNVSETAKQYMAGR